jgi:hypothetical protein
MTTVKPKQEPEISIPSNDPKSDVWNFISYFESEYFVRRFIEKRIRRKIHYRNASILKKLKKNNNVITYDPTRLQDVKAVVSEITINAKQSRDIYEKSKELPLLSKPILLHYVFEKLANILVLHTFRDVKIPYSHGLTYYGR